MTNTKITIAHNEDARYATDHLPSYLSGVFSVTYTTTKGQGKPYYDYSETCIKKQIQKFLCERQHVKYTQCTIQIAFCKDAKRQHLRVLRKAKHFTPTTQKGYYTVVRG